MALLEVKNLGISFGGLRAVNEFNISVEKGQLYGLIGPNGAGKTTVFNLLTGVYQPDEGAILLDGVNLTGKKTMKSAKRVLPELFRISDCLVTCLYLIMLRWDCITIIPIRP